jgi:hypothetical protein
VLGDLGGVLASALSPRYTTHDTRRAIASHHRCPGRGTIRCTCLSLLDNRPSLSWFHVRLCICITVRRLTFLLLHYARRPVIVCASVVVRPSSSLHYACTAAAKHRSSLVQKYPAWPLQHSFFDALSRYNCVARVPQVLIHLDPPSLVGLAV